VVGLSAVLAELTLKTDGLGMVAIGVLYAAAQARHVIGYFGE